MVDLRIFAKTPNHREHEHGFSAKMVGRFHQNSKNTQPVHQEQAQELVDFEILQKHPTVSGARIDYLEKAA